MRNETEEMLTYRTAIIYDCSMCFFLFVLCVGQFIIHQNALSVPISVLILLCLIHYFDYTFWTHLFDIFCSIEYTIFIHTQNVFN